MDKILENLISCRDLIFYPISIKKKFRSERELYYFQNISLTF